MASPLREKIRRVWEIPATGKRITSEGFILVDGPDPDWDKDYEKMSERGYVLVEEKRGENINLTTPITDSAQLNDELSDLTLRKEIQDELDEDFDE